MDPFLSEEALGAASVAPGASWVETAALGSAEEAPLVNRGHIGRCQGEGRQAEAGGDPKAGVTGLFSVGKTLRCLKQAVVYIPQGAEELPFIQFQHPPFPNKL